MKPYWEFNCRPLDQKVLAVAAIVSGQDGEVQYWRSFIGPVPGRDFNEEAASVLIVGTSLEEDVARALWPQYAEVRYRR